jgi:hypothetical protein
VPVFALIPAYSRSESRNYLDFLRVRSGFEPEGRGFERLGRRRWHLDYLESQVPAGGFIFDDLTVADLALASPFVDAAFVRYTIDAALRPKVSRS